MNAPFTNPPDLSVNQFRLYFEAGYRRLVPIVPPDAPLSPESSLSKRPGSRGKAVGFKGRDGLWRGFDWVRAPEPTEEQLDAWHTMGAGVGVRTGQGIFGLDIDILDWQIASRVKEIAYATLGPGVMRTGRAPKLLLLYHSDEALSYSRLEFPNGQRIELLGEGRQFVSEGIHPTTGKPYDWQDGRRVRADGLATITAEQLKAFYETVCKEFPQAAEPKPGTLTGDNRPGDQSALKGKIEHVQQAVRALTNPADFGYDDYIRVGAAIKAATQDDEAIGLYLFQEWAAKWEGGENSFDRVQADWNRIKAPYGIGAQWLYDHAAQHGFDKGAVDVERFDVLPNAGATDVVIGKIDFERASRFSVEELDALKPPEFVLGSRFQPGQLTLGIGPPGVSKSTFMLLTAAAIVTGQALTGEPVFKAGPVLIYNAEDPREVILRRINAIAKRFGLDRASIADRVHVLSGYDGARLVFAERAGNGAPIRSSANLEDF